MQRYLISFMLLYQSAHESILLAQSFEYIKTLLVADSKIDLPLPWSENEAETRASLPTWLRVNMAAAESLANGIKDLQVNDEQSNNLTYQEQSDAFVQLWGFALDDLYKIALKFFKGRCIYHATSFVTFHFHWSVNVCNSVSSRVNQ